jgi:hypothetical protein
MCLSPCVCLPLRASAPTSAFCSARAPPSRTVRTVISDRSSSPSTFRFLSTSSRDPTNPLLHHRLRALSLPLPNPQRRRCHRAPRSPLPIHGADAAPRLPRSVLRATREAATPGSVSICVVVPPVPSVSTSQDPTLAIWPSYTAAIFNQIPPLLHRVCSTSTQPCLGDTTA